MRFLSFFLGFGWRWSREKVVVPATKRFITFEGAGRDVTVIEWHDRASDRGPDGQQLRTYQTASVTVYASYFSAKNISFKVPFFFLPFQSLHFLHIPNFCHLKSYAFCKVVLIFLVHT